jgi:hypothetical protein
MLPKLLVGAQSSFTRDGVSRTAMGQKQTWLRAVQISAKAEKPTNAKPLFQGTHPALLILRGGRSEYEAYAEGDLNHPNA